MRKSILVLCLLLLIAACLDRAAAQENSKAPETAQASDAPVHYYQLEFVVQELNSDGKVVNGRTYTGIASTNRRDFTVSIRTGSRIPVSTGPSSASSGSQSQIQYIDVGVNIDLRDAIHEVGNQLAFTLAAEVSSLSPNTPAVSANPVIRQNRWQASVLIPVGKPTVVFKSDDLDTKGSMQVTVKATPLQ